MHSRASSAETIVRTDGSRTSIDRYLNLSLSELLVGLADMVPLEL